MGILTDFLNALRFDDEIDMDTAGELMSDAADVIEQQMAKIERLKRERDAITALINQKAFKPIEECDKYDKCYAEAAKQGKMLPCITCNSWQWRGVKEDTANG